jgi:hypothetical protein
MTIVGLDIVKRFKALVCPVFLMQIPESDPSSRQKEIRHLPARHLTQCSVWDSSSQYGYSVFAVRRSDIPLEFRKRRIPLIASSREGSGYPAGEESRAIRKFVL